MKKSRFNGVPAHWAGVIAIAAAGAAFFVSPLVSVLLLFLYILLCLAACFFPRMQFLGPMIGRGSRGSGAVSVTFDDGPAEPTTRRVLDLLDRYNAKATFFVSGANALRHPDLIAEILRRGHSIGNHSFSHDPCLMLRSGGTLYREIQRAQQALSSLGVEPLAFRPPVGIINPKLDGILNTLGMYGVVFSRRAGDAGNRRIAGLGRKILSGLKPGDIILMHDVPPRYAADEVLYAEMEAVLKGIGAAGLKIAPLAELIGRPVMKCHV
ncbi:MAG TPA: polysaccharide deacetylase family protein [Smithellaceae bacterium]|nr:polysaccharide deacetylase family protein [Smithellaceae bacterium]